MTRTAVLLASAVAALGSCRPHRRPPIATAGPAWLLARAQQEVEQAERSPAFHDFQFTDRLTASGITFENRIVDDAGKAYKKVHYDHGTGLCAADVDGDGLPDLYFVTQLGASELWKNVGGGRFVNITAAAGLEMPDAVAAACAFADIDNDGLPDLFVTTVRHGNRLFHNVGGGKFQDITAQAGVGYVGHSSGAVFFDYDGDGLLDLFVTNVGVYTSNAKGPGGYYVGLPDAFHGHTHPDRAEASILYHNLGGGRFKDVTRAVGLVDSSWSGDATVLDVNDDGRPDLYILNMQGENHLWLNEGGKRFRDATREYFPRTPWGAMGVKAFDFDGDGRVDLLVTDMHDDMWANIPPGDWAAETRKADSSKAPPDFFPGGKDRFIFGNALFANRGGGRFEEVSDSLGVETYWPWGPSVDDLNADGWDDIFITAGMNFPHRYGINSLLLNEAGRHFLPSEFLVGVEPRAH
ncbi:MAG TPA: VCBS repeat-containing protein, partial [Gemmatimonadales bacterium]|nr:VCBS repeat-containing protein [Gemmatimonadales bacterium]